MTNKIQLNDVTFLIPLRIDSIERLENLEMTIEYLSQNFTTNIHILEAAKYNNNYLDKILTIDLKITFIEDFDPIFYRTRYINQLIDSSKTNIVAVWDADIVVPAKQILDAVNLIRNQKADFVYPYENDFLDTSKIIRELYYVKRDIKVLQENKNKMKKLYQPNPVGGGFFANRESYIKIGKENENFYGWGHEDGDRTNRWCKLGYEEKRVKGALYHFTHDRGVNSNYHSESQKEIKSMEIARISTMTEEELQYEIKTWGWV